jgi:hypothetical protein
MLPAHRLPLRVIYRLLTVAWLTAVTGIFTSAAQAQQNGFGSSIYTCTDATGRALTSDRPIAACIDRNQRVLNNQGWVVKVVPPELTDTERAARQEQQHQAQLALRRQRDQERFNQALLIRYPDQATHEASRSAALAQAQSLLDNAKQELAALESGRATLAAQMAADASGNAPDTLRRGIASNAQAIETQQQLIAGFQAEVNRINTQFNAEDKRLQPLWQNRSPPASAVPPK